MTLCAYVLKLDFTTFTHAQIYYSTPPSSN